MSTNGSEHFSSAGHVVGFSRDLGTKVVQEDVLTASIVKDGRVLLVAADGHGRDGQYIARKASDLVAEEMLRFSSPPTPQQQEDALLRSDERLRDDLIQAGRMEVDAEGNCPLEGRVGGCTLGYVLFIGDKVLVGWVGDTLAGVCFRDGRDPFVGKAHDSGNRREVARVLRRSGYIRSKRVQGRLLPFRSVGDFHLKNRQREGRQQIVPALPEVASFDRDEVAFAFAFSDGLTLTWSREQAAVAIVQEVRRLGIAGGAARAILNAAAAADWAAGRALRDNACVILGGKLGHDKQEETATKEEEEASHDEEESISTIPSI